MLRQQFAELYQQYLPSVWHYVRSRVPGHHQAQDVTSEVFVRAWQGLPRYNPDRAPLRAWLFGIAHHAVADWWRRERPGGTPRETAVPQELLHLIQGVPLVPAPDLSPDAAVLAAERQAALRRAVAQLSQREQDALALRFAGGLKSAEVAAVLGLSEGATKMLIHRAIQKLKGVITRDEPEL
jgi:RNA polymerase sigma factor (sigma-70 family)